MGQCSSKVLADLPVTKFNACVFARMSLSAPAASLFLFQPPYLVLAVLFCSCDFKCLPYASGSFSQAFFLGSCPNFQMLSECLHNNLEINVSQSKLIISTHVSIPPSNKLILLYFWAKNRGRRCLLKIPLLPSYVISH